jgi:membrane protein
MKFSFFIIFKTTIQRFHRDKCGNFAIIISYFALMCSIPLAALFAYITTKILGTAELAVRSLDVFSEEFFAQLDPYFFERVQELSQNITNLGWFGLAGSFIAASFLFSPSITSSKPTTKSPFSITD